MGVHKSPCVLFIGHDRELTVHCEMLLRHLGYRVMCVENFDETWSLRASANAILIDASSDGEPNGLTVLNYVRSVDSAIPIVMISGRPNSIDVVRAMKNGATNFLFGVVSEDELRRALETKTHPHSDGRTRPRRFSTAAKEVLFGDSPQMRDVRAIIEQLYWSDAPVLIRGERGTGKSVLAREVHAHSARAGTRFFKLDCSKLKPDRLEAALFGSMPLPDNARGTRIPGIFEKSARGTLLIEEIGEMETVSQSKLLRVLRDSSCRQIGAPHLVRADLRIIATTSVDLEKTIMERGFNPELYEYLEAISIRLPALRDRVQDILPLTELLIRADVKAGSKTPEITEDVKDAITNYHWPGNVRELKSFSRRVVHLRDARAAARELRPLQSHRSAGMDNSN